MTEFRPPVPQPCNDCPFRRKSMPGWLGNGSPESFVDCINRDEYMPCHQSIDYDDPLWKAKWGAQENGSGCAGALIMAANMIKRPRDPALPRMPADKETVFTTFVEFVAHHRSLGSGSWDDDEQTEDAKEVRARMLRAQANCPHPEHRRGTHGRLKSNQEVCMQCGATVLKKRAPRKR